MVGHAFVVVDHIVITSYRINGKNKYLLNINCLTTQVKELNNLTMFLRFSQFFSNTVPRPGEFLLSSSQNL